MAATTRCARVGTPAPVRVPSRAPNGREAALDAICAAICRGFLIEARQPEPWLDAAASELLRVAGASAQAAECAGVWTALIEPDLTGLPEIPMVGAAGYGDEFDLASARSRIAAEFSAPACGRLWMVPPGAASRPNGKKSASKPALSTPSTPEAPAPADTVEPKPLPEPHIAVHPGLWSGSIVAIIDGDRPGSSILCAGFEARSGTPVPDAADDPLLRRAFSALALAAATRLVRPRLRRRDFAARLSAAQRAILPLVLDGYTEPEIAAKLGRSPHTIHDHVRSIYRLLHVGSRAELLVAWRKIDIG